MEKIERKPGLVRYDSLNGLNGGRTRFIRGRTIAYSILGAVGLAAFAVSALSVKPMNVTATRMKGAPFFMGDGLIRNQFNVQVINKHNAPARFLLELRDAPGIQLNLAGTALEVPALGQASPLAVLTLAQRDYHGPAAVTLAVREDKPGGASIERKLEILGPDIRLQDNDYLNPEHYKK
jgi:polyferredoxin